MAHSSHHILRAALHIIINLTLPFTLECCSVKEMREACPCRVDLDLTALLECRGGCRQGAVEVSVFDTSGAPLLSHRFGADTCKSHYELLVPRGQYDVCALYFSDIDGWEFSANSVRLGDGAEADSLFGEGKPLDASGESGVFRPEGLKQFTTVNVYFAAPASAIAVEISTPSNALGIPWLTGHGERATISGLVSGQKFSRRICRQSSDDIVVSLRNALAGRMIAQVSIASLMRSKSYDYSARSLGDIDITVDLGLGEITLETEGWKESFLNVIF